MTNEFEYLMRLVAASVRGDWKDIPDADVNWEMIDRLAKDQSVQFLLGYSLRKMPTCSCPYEIRQRLVQQMRSTSMLNHARTSEIVSLLNDMETAGIHNVMFKGWSVARYYAAPEARVSSDADVWVAPRDEKKALRYLENRGFEITNQRWKNGHHSECSHPVLGMLDLHVIFYDELVEDVWFQKMDGSEFINEPHLKVSDSIGTYYTLNYTDHLIYQFLHMAKHFIQTGLSLRIILDIAVFFSANKKMVDCQRVWDTINDLNYGELADCVLWIAILYCGFAAEDFPGISEKAPDQIQLILEDLEKGGWMGINDKAAREEGWYEYNRQIMLKQMKPWEYNLRMLFWKHASIRHFFPDRQEMIKQYPWLKGKTFLLPLAWPYRLITKSIRRVLDGKATQGIISEKTKISDSGKARVEMFKELKMM